MASLRIGLIGCGHMGRVVHLNNLARFPHVEVVALAEPDAQRRQAASEQAPRAAAYAEYGELLERTDIDAVLICLPNALHADVAIKALQRGKHIYLEKPLAINLEDGGKIVEAWRRSARVGMIGFNYRFNRLHQEVRRHLQAGVLGELIAARSVFSSARQHAPAWQQTRQTGGGVLLNLASHHVDLVRFWFGQCVQDVFATVRSQRVEADSATVELRLADGLLVQSFFSMSSANDDRFDIYGRGGALRFDRHNSWSVTVTKSACARTPTQRLQQALTLLRGSPIGMKKFRTPTWEPSFAAALAHFVHAARTGTPASPDLMDGYQSLTVIAAAEQSAQTGSRVAIA
jgi:myo-inositol 2-dehydrogenase / D-chiro-inositol 1-dehydrogenase